MEGRAAAAVPADGPQCASFSFFAACLCRITSDTDTSTQLPIAGGGSGGGGGGGGQIGVEVRTGTGRGVEHGVPGPAGRMEGPVRQMRNEYKCIVCIKEDISYLLDHFILPLRFTNVSQVVLFS